MKILNFKLILVVVLTFTFISCKESKVKKRPNFLFVLTDDQSPFDLQIYDTTSVLQTPTIDKLAKEGMVFDGARHMGSWLGGVCTPSRHMIMSGRTLWNLPAKNKQFISSQLPDSLEYYTMGAIFNKAGYKTMRTCKKGNSYAAANKMFSVVKEAKKRGGTDESGSAWHANQVLNYLTDRETKQDKDPFFVFLGFSHPHDTRDGKPELLEKYGATNHKDSIRVPELNPKQPQLQENYLREHPFFHGHPGLRDEERVSGVWKKRDENTVRNELGREYACSENIDIQLNKVLKKIEAMGELDNTYIVYTSDHGIAIGRHGLMGKQNLYEHTWRVPFIIKGPGIEAGKRVKGDVYLADILPTFCELANIEIPKTVQSKSFKSILDGKEESIRDIMYGVYCGGTKPGMRSVKKDNWKLIKYDLMDGSIQKTQLFNLEENPHEYLIAHKRDNELETNLAGNPKYKDKLEEMEALLLEQMETYGDPYRLWNQKD